MAVTGAIFRGLIFDGINSKDYGIYITGTGVYNAPERDVTMVSIPGRNGDLAIDNGRFNNIEVTYHCGTFGDSQEDFAEGISRFRNALCSRQGYVRITDDYNSGEYRLGIYKHGLDVDAEAVKGGEFDIVFDCKPQRFLLDGDNPVQVASSNTITNPTLFDAKPILSFEGIGNIGIGNKTIKVKDVPLGWITIANGAPGESMDLRVVDTSYTLDMSNVNTGDTIMAGDYSNGNIGNFLAVTRARNMPAFDSVRTTKSGDYYIDANATKVSSSEIQTGVSFSNVVFTAGTSADLSATSKIEFYSGSTRVGVVQWDTQVHYDGGNTIRVIAQIATDATLYKKYELSVPKTRANSTKSTLTGTTYIDLDVEEAWMKSNGQTIVSANDHVVLGAEPPVLPPGATRITYNGTITNLKITPRWWRV